MHEPSVSGNSKDSGSLNVFWFGIACLASISLPFVLVRHLGPPDFDWLAVIGLILGFLGLIVTIFGFILALQQIRKTNSASEAANFAISKLRKDLSSLDVIADIKILLSLSSNIQEDLTNQKYHEALLSFKKIHAGLNRLVATQGAVPHNFSESAKDFIAKMLAACSVMETVIENSNTVFSKSALATQLRELEGLLINLEISLKEKFGG
jgi:hypothetical protein